MSGYLPRSYLQHGERQGPHSSDPAENGPIWYVAASAATPWAAGTYHAGDVVSDFGFNWTCLATTTREPDFTTDWPAGGFWELTESYFQNDFVNSGDGSGGTDDLTSFWLVVGKGLEQQINFTGGIDQTIAYALPPYFWTRNKQSFPAVDDNGDFTCITVVGRDDATGCADVYAGRV